MCGIVAYNGYQQCDRILLETLQKLEYRGYDSAGICLMTQNNEFKIYKTLKGIKSLDNNKYPSSTCGIAHTRWATQGKVSIQNAHPIVDKSKRLAIVHNGNFKFKYNNISNKTDTKIFVDQLEDGLSEFGQFGLLGNIKLSQLRVDGQYAFVCIGKDNSKNLYGAVKDAPLVLGIMQDGFILASDIEAITWLTSKYIIIPSEASFIVGKNYYNIFQGDQQVFPIEQTYINKTNNDIILSDYMYKEIHEIAEIFVNFHSMKHGFPYTERVVMVGCGSSRNAALLAEYFIEQNSDINVEVEYANELIYKRIIDKVSNQYVFISQSGETYDVLKAIDFVQNNNKHCIGITSSTLSSLSRKCNATYKLDVGSEKSVASTKTFVASYMKLLSCFIDIDFSPVPLKQTIIDVEQSPDTQKITDVLVNHKDKPVFYLGSNYNYALACEGALKLKELSYIHAEAYPCSEMRHGPIALIDTDTPVIFLDVEDTNYIEEMKCRGATTIYIGFNKEIGNRCHLSLILPEEDNKYIKPIIATIALQWIAYFTGKKLNRNIDQPRNLAKSVTV